MDEQIDKKNGTVSQEIDPHIEDNFILNKGTIILQCVLGSEMALSNNDPAVNKYPYGKKKKSSDLYLIPYTKN